MNIGIVTAWFDGGAGYVSRAYMDILSKNYDVYIYARHTVRPEEGDSFWRMPNVTFDNRRAGTFVVEEEFKSWIVKNNISIIIFNEQNDKSVVNIAKSLGVKTIGYVDYYSKETVSHFNIYDMLFCNTKRHYSVFKHHPGAKFIQWGTNIGLFPLNRNSSPEPIFFHNAGTFGTNGRKGTVDAIQAFDSINRNNTKLVIHSIRPMSRLSNEMVDIINCNDNIEYIYDFVKPPGLYHLGNIYLYPSKLEGIGLSIAEAMSSGLPVITSNNPPMSEFVEHDKTGRLIEIDSFKSRNYYWKECIINKNSLKEQMLYYIDNPEKIVTHGNDARLSAEQKFDFNKKAEEINKCVEELL